MQRAAGGKRPDRHRLAQQHRPGVEAGIHLHDGDPALRVAGQHRRLDRCRPAPARQQAGVDIQAAAPRRLQHRRRQDQAVGRHHRRIQPKRRKRRLGRCIAAQPRLRAHLQPQFVRGTMHGAALHCLPAAGRPRRLAIHRSDRMPRLDQRPQRRDGEIRAAHEGQAHRRAYFPSFFCRCSLASRRMMMLRFSAERRSTNRMPSRWSISCCRQADSKPSASTSRRAPVWSR